MWYLLPVDKTYDQLVPLLAEHGIVRKEPAALVCALGEPLVEVFITPTGDSYPYGGLRLIKQLPLWAAYCWR